MKIVYTAKEFNAYLNLSGAIVKDFSHETYAKINSIGLSDINKVMGDQGFNYDETTGLVTFEVPEEQTIAVCGIMERYAGPIGNVLNGIYGMIKTLKYMFKDMEENINKVFEKPPVKEEAKAEPTAAAANPIIGDGLIDNQ